MTSNKEKYYEMYYNNFIELLDNLSVIRPYDSSLLLFKGYKNIFESTYGKKGLVETMDLYVKNYIDKILKKDESFFLTELEKDFKDQSFIVNEIKKIREIWLDSSTTEQHKKIIWKHFIIFAKLSKVI